MQISRRLFLSTDGGDFRGEDSALVDEGRERLFERRLAKLPRSQRRVGFPFTARFHLHPTVKASLVADGEAVTMRLPSGEIWVMRQAGGALALARAARRDAFVLSALDHVLVLERSVFGRARPTDALDLEWVEALELAPGSNAKLLAKMSDGQELTLWTGSCPEDDAQALVDALATLSRQKRLSLDARLAQG